jgi:hypothetical protein
MTAHRWKILTEASTVSTAVGFGPVRQSTSNGGFVSLITGKPKKVDAQEALNRAVEAAQATLDNEHGPQLSAVDWAILAIALQKR